VVNEQDFNVTQLANDEHLHALALLRDSGQVVAEKRLLEAYLFELQPPIAPPAAEAALAIDAREVALTVSAGGDRTQYLMDRNADTRWFGGQDGTSWIAAAFKRSVNIARVDLRLAERSLADYPRELEIDAMDVGGAMRILYRATPYPEFIAGFVRDPKYPRITIALPENETTTITIREIGKADGRWWSVHEIELWQRRSR
jgi:hypothetical protein